MKVRCSMRKLIMIVTLLGVLLGMATSGWARDVTLNFKNADIRALIEFVAGFSGKNFLVDNRVKGNVTIISPSPISEEEAYEVFLSVLEINGFATVPSGSVIKIVPRAESKQMPVPLFTRGHGQKEDDAMVTRVVRLKYADAQQLSALIRPLIPPNGHLVAYPRGNMLLVTDSARNISRIEKILSIMDRKDAVGVQLFHLKHASADKLATTLNNLYSAQGGAPAQGITQLRAFAQQPGNMLIVIGAPQTINEVATVIEKLDVAPEADSGRLRVIYLQHAKAEDMAKVLNELVGGQSAATAQAGAAVAAKPLFTGDVKIVPDPATNALLITAGPSDMTAVSRIIDRLDIRRRQVLIEALLVEVSGNALERFGVEWMGKTGQFFGVQGFGNLQGVGKALADNAAQANPVSRPLVLAQTASAGATVGWVNSALSIGAMAQALEADADANVLSTPNILTMDNEEAEIIVGQNVPFITGVSASTGNANPNPFQTIERKDIGLTLRVKPQISGGDTVRLELYQEVSSIDNAASANTNSSDLITKKRSIKTVVLANNSQMIVLGGLMREDNTASVQKVPCIGAIPLLGEPFKFTENQHRKTNLMVFLKPSIIKNTGDIEEITDRKYFDIRQLYERPIEGGTILFPQKTNTMPETLKPAGKAKKTDVAPAPKQMP